jgi:hypothetical protein
VFLEFWTSLSEDEYSEYHEKADSCDNELNFYYEIVIENHEKTERSENIERDSFVFFGNFRGHNRQRYHNHNCAIEVDELESRIELGMALFMGVERVIGHRGDH